MGRQGRRITRITRVFVCAVRHGAQDSRIGRVLKPFSCYFFPQETCENLGWMGIDESVVISFGYVLDIEAGDICSGVYDKIWFYG